MPTEEEMLAQGIAGAFKGTVVTNLEQVDSADLGQSKLDTVAQTNTNDTSTKPEDINKNSSLNTGENEGNAIAKPDESKAPEVKILSFEERLTELSGGKFKAWEDLEKVIAEPKVEFTNDYTKEFNDFAKDFADPEIAFDMYVRHKTTDYDEMGILDLITMQESASNPTLSDDEITELVNLNYRVDEWSDDEEEPNALKKAMQVKMKADAERARVSMKDSQAKLLAQHKKPSPEQVEKQSLESKANWKKLVDSTTPTMDKLPIKVGENQSVDFIIDKAEAQSIKDAAYKSGEDIVGVIEPFITENGKFSGKKFGEMMVKIRNFDKIVHMATSQAFALGQKNVAADIKNINFTPDSGQQKPSLTPQQAQSKAIADSLLKNM